MFIIVIKVISSFILKNFSFDNKKYAIKNKLFCEEWREEVGNIL